jgi:hypothetical protein
MLKVIEMFAPPKHLFHRAPATPASTPSAAEDPPVTDVTSHRHPAMRGLNVPPVHGRHCICDRCSSSRAA